jgi:predicted peroxiredoxin
MNMTDKLIFNCTHGSDEPERAILPFVAANVAATAGQDAVVLYTIDAVWLGTSDGADGIAQPGLPVLNELSPTSSTTAVRFGSAALARALAGSETTSCGRAPRSSARPRSSRRSSTEHERSPSRRSASRLTSPSPDGSTREHESASDGCCRENGGCPMTEQE